MVFNDANFLRCLNRFTATPSVGSHPSMAATPLPPSPKLPPIMSTQLAPSSPPHRGSSPRRSPRELADPYPRRFRTPPTPVSQSTNGKPVRHRQRKAREDKTRVTRNHHVRSPAHDYAQSTASRSRSSAQRQSAPHTIPPPAPRRTMLERQFYILYMLHHNQLYGLIFCRGLACCQHD